MAHKSFLVTMPNGVLKIIHPAYNDRARTILDDAEFEVQAVSKTLFELSRDQLPTPDPTMTQEELDNWRLNVHYNEYVGVMPLTTCGECLESDVPIDRTFRDAWEAPEGTIQVNMPKARGIQMDRIRLVRNAELVKKDIEFMKALEAEDGSHKVIATEKQVLRDIPQTFDLTTENNSPEELKQKWPEN